MTLAIVAVFPVAEKYTTNTFMSLTPLF